jgi:hypothetical protein
MSKTLQEVIAEVENDAVGKRDFLTTMNNLYMNNSSLILV